MKAEPRSVRTFADAGLKGAARFSFLVTLAGQLLFAFTVGSAYSFAAARGNWRGWNRSMTHGYVAGDSAGNLIVVIHIISAVLLLLSGAIQFVPQVRSRAPAFHRWNGRVYVVTAFTASLAGFYMLWVRGSVGGFVAHVGVSIQGLLIMVCAVMALRHARARDFPAHRRWALRLFLVVSAAVFVRAAGVLAGLGLEQDTFITVTAFGQYLVPLAMLELYFRAQDGGGVANRLAVAGGLSVLTVVLAAGILAVTLGSWAPRIRRAFDSRTSIGDVLAATIASAGIESAETQYRALKAAGAPEYRFDELELNDLGYELLRVKDFSDAIRVLELNAEAYPLSGNSWDSLAEAYMDAGDTARATAGYLKSLQRNPKNANAVQMLKKLAPP